MKIKNNLSRNYLSLAILTSLILVIILNYLWLNNYGFNKTPIIGIDLLIVINFVLGTSFAKKVPMAPIMLYSLNIMLCLLGFILIHGLLFVI